MTKEPIRKRAGAFFDRDGVLNVDHGYVYRPDQWDWALGAKEAILACNRLGYVVIVVTNQSGIGRGFYTEEAMRHLHAFVQGELAPLGAHIDAFYFCPHLPEAQCRCRKPSPGMILDAIRDFQLDPSASFLLGDKDSDLAAAQAAGIRGIKHHSGDPFPLVPPLAL